MSVKTLKITDANYPQYLREIPCPPKVIYYVGNLTPLLDKPRLAIIGSRRVSPYGKSVTTKLAREAAEQRIVIISGLALGVDGLAHQATLEAGGKTIAVLANGLDRIYPALHKQLAERILKQGGAIISEYPVGTEARRENFIARNRIVSGLSEAVLITEAAAKSGTIHTANFALEQGRTVMAVPGNITSQFSEGTNNLIKTGATPVTSVDDILNAMGLERQSQDKEVLAANQQEAIIIDLLKQGISDGAELLILSKLEAPTFNQTLTMLEITAKIRPLGAGHWTLT